MALSVNTGAEMSIPYDLNILSDSIIRFDDADTAFQSSYTIDDDISCLNWEMMIWLYNEIQAIMEQKGLTWWDAVNELYVRESRLPFVLGGKYLCYTLIKVVLSAIIPGGAVINFLQELVDDGLGDIAGDHLPGSPGEVIKRSRQSKSAVKFLDTIIFKDNKGGK